MNRVYLGIGGNMGDRWLHLQECTALLSFHIGEIIKQSLVYKTKAWGKTNQADFYNQVIHLDTQLDVKELLAITQKIEINLGRVKKDKWGERIIDIDILFFNDEIINKKKCIVPHKHLHKRKFVLIPLAEIAPKWIHPILNKNMLQLLDECDDALKVEIVKKK